MSEHLTRGQRMAVTSTLKRYNDSDGQQPYVDQWVNDSKFVTPVIDTLLKEYWV
jgi:hypothetical protein